MRELFQFVEKHSYRIAAIVPAVVGIGVVPYFAVRFSTEEFGIYALCESVVPILIAFFSLGIPQALLTFKPDHVKESYDIFLSHTMILGGALGGALGLLAIFFYLFNITGIFFTGTRSLLFSLVALTAAVEIPLYFFQSAYRAADRPLSYMSLAVVHPILSAVGGVSFCEIWGQSSDLFLLARTLSGSFLLFISASGIKFSWKYSVVKSVIKVGFPLMPANLISMFLPSLPRFFLISLSGPVSLGLFTFAWKAAVVANLLVVQPAILLWHTVLFKNLDFLLLGDVVNKFLKKYLNQSFLFLSTIFILFVFGDILGGRFLWLHDIFEKFDLFLVFSISLSWIIGGVAQILNIGPYVRKKTSSVLRCYILAGVFYAILGIILIFKFAHVGAAVALLLYQVILSFLLWRNSQAIEKVKISFKYFYIFFIVQIVSMIILMIL